MGLRRPGGYEKDQKGRGNAALQILPQSTPFAVQFIASAHHKMAQGRLELTGNPDAFPVIALRLKNLDSRQT